MPACVESPCANTGIHAPPQAVNKTGSGFVPVRIERHKTPVCGF